MKNSPHAAPWRTHTHTNRFFQSLKARRAMVWLASAVVLTGVLGWVAWHGVSAQQSQFNINTVVGSSGGTGLVAELRNARGVAAFSTFFYVTDTGNHVVRRFNTADNSATIVAGRLGVASTSPTDTNGDGGLATGPTASLKEPYDVVADQSGNLYISDTGNRRIRKLDTSTDLISTVIGNGVVGASDGPVNGPVLSEPRGLFLLSDKLYVADSGSNRVMLVEALSQLSASTPITGIAGNGFSGADGDGGQATLATLNNPRDIAVMGDTVYIADTGNNKIRRVIKNAASREGGGLRLIDYVAPQSMLTPPAFELTVLPPKGWTTTLPEGWHPSLSGVATAMTMDSSQALTVQMAPN